MYAAMFNTLDESCLEPILHEDFRFSSQMVLEEISSKEAFIHYIRGKLQTIRNAKASVYAEMGTITFNKVPRPCVLLAQDSRDNLVGLAIAETSEGLLHRIDLCIVPSPKEAERTGNYPER